MAPPAFGGAPGIPSFRKRQVIYFDGNDDYFSQQPKRPRRCSSCEPHADDFSYTPPLRPAVYHHQDEIYLSQPVPTRPYPPSVSVNFSTQHERSPYLEPASDRNFDFLLLEKGSPLPIRDPHLLIERTASGLSISSDTTERCAATKLLEDDEAAQRVREHMGNFKRRNPDSTHERILRSIIQPRSNYPIDNEALQSIFSAANEIFFNGRLSQRVTWDWSHASSSQYDSQVIGTTALRRASNRGFETLIVLSSPILNDSQYSRRLLISTFLHELVHSYMFICCGFRARLNGGHTAGFREIARMIDDWVGPDSHLYLSKMEADLDSFRAGGPRERSPPSNTYVHDDYDHEVYPCSGYTDSQAGVDDYAEPYNGGEVAWWPSREQPAPNVSRHDARGPPYVYN